MMPKSADQLLLPVNPLFVWGTLIGARIRPLPASC